MKTTQADKRDIIVQTLLEVVHRVIEVRRDNIITNIWDRPGAVFNVPPSEFVGKKMSEVRNNSVFIKSNELIETAFRTGENNGVEYTTLSSTGKPVTYHIRALLNHPDKNFLFLTSEILSETRHPELIDDKWKLALDAAGDGIWDLHVETGKIFFSPKWYDIFGYEPGDIIYADDWTSKVHPDDLLVVRSNFEKYLNGDVPNYSCEIRYLCKDGSYKWILSRGVVVAKTPDGKPLRFIGTHKDINKRKKLEEEHQTNLNLLLKLMNSLPSGILVTDQYRKLVFANQSFCDLFNITQPPGELSGLNGDDRLNKNKLFYKHQEDFLERTERLMREKKLFLNDEYEMADGRTLSRDYIPLTFKENYTGEIWKFTDITEQKNIDNRFSEQRRFYEHLLTSIPTNISALDSEGRFLYLNPNSIGDKELREWSIGRTLPELHDRLQTPKEHVERWMGYFHTSKQEKRKVEWVDRIPGENGQSVYMLRYFSPILSPAGDIDMIIGHGINITGRVEAEDALKTSMNAFAHSFNYSGIAKALLAPGGKWLEVNDVLCKLTGYTREELQELHYRDITYPDDIDIDVPYIQQLLNKEIESYTIEKRYVAKNRQIIVTSLTVSLLWNNDGTPKYFICDLIDITAKKVLSEELHRQNAELEATKTSLINKINQLQELSHMIAHNLRGPAGNINMLAERLIADDNAPSVTPQLFTREEANSIIYKSSISLNNSLNTLIELSEIKLNKDIEYNDCNFGIIINDIIRQLQGTIFLKHAKIIQELSVETVRYPKVYLESILYNLLSNALKYTHPKKAPLINISTTYVNGKVSLSVKDNGLGINLAKYGNQVFQLNKIFHKGFDSKGVGLFLTKSQIESLGGSIEVNSRPKYGCEFIVTL